MPAGAVVMNGGWWATNRRGRASADVPRPCTMPRRDPEARSEMATTSYYRSSDRGRVRAPPPCPTPQAVVWIRKDVLHYAPLRNEDVREDSMSLSWKECTTRGYARAKWDDGVPACSVPRIDDPRVAFGVRYTVASIGKHIPSLSCHCHCRRTESC
jgi:hypothetical protein